MFDAQNPMSLGKKTSSFGGSPIIKLWKWSAKMQPNPTFINKKMLEIRRRRKKKLLNSLGHQFFPKKKWSPNILRQLACLGRSWPAAPLGWCPPPAPGASAAAPGGAAMVLLALKNQDRSDHGELSEPSRESISMCLSFYGFQCVYLSKYLHNASYLYIFVHSIIHLFAHSGLQSTLPPIWARLCGYKRCVSHSE